MIPIDLQIHVQSSARKGGKNYQLTSAFVSLLVESPEKQKEEMKKYTFAGIEEVCVWVISTMSTNPSFVYRNICSNS